VTHLAVLLPGAGYGVDNPLLWYARSALQQVGAVEVAVRYEHRLRPHQWDDRSHPFWTDVRTKVAAALDEHRPDRLTLVGKSLGTIAMGELARAGVTSVAAVWLTPIWGHDATFEAARTCGWRSMYAVGTADTTYVPERQARLPGDVVVVEGANHSLESEGDVLADLDAMRRITAAVVDFVA
jgi:hypothetical protein